MKDFERVAKWAPALLALLLIAGLAFFGDLMISVQGGSSSSGGKASPPSTPPSTSASSSSGGSTSASSSSSSGGSTSASSSSSSGAPIGQTNVFDAGHAFDLQINGKPNTLSGTDHDVDGNVKPDQSKAVPAVAQALLEAASWVNCTNVRVERVDAPDLRASLTRELTRTLA